MKQTNVSIYAQGYWNGNVVTEEIMEKVLENYTEEEINNITDTKYEKWGNSVSCDQEDLDFNFKSRKEAKKFVRSCVRPAEGYNDRITVVDKGDIVIYFHAIDDDGPFEVGDYMSDGMYYQGRY